ncbi:MAG: hypothetical protein ACOH18_05575 [Candidatus Saccharimonadaceae bacterium]
MADFNNDTAREARDDFESMQMALSTPWGEKLKAKLEEIDTNASNKALRGDTPPNTNVFFESRGRVGAIFQINQLIIDTQKKNDDAILWQQNNPPTEKPASEKTE